MKTIFLYGHSTVENIILALREALSENGIKNEIKRCVTTNLVNEPWIGIFHRSPLMPQKYIAYNTESMILPKAHTIIDKVFKNATEIWDYAQINVDLLQTKFNIRLVPIGYSSIYERKYAENTNGFSPQKDIDFLMYGWYTERRAKIINELKKHYHTVWLGEDGKHEYAVERDKLIARSKIVISVCKTEPFVYGTNDFSRLSYLIANKIFTISEPIGDRIIEPLWSEKIIFSNYDNFVECCYKYINLEKTRNDMCHEAYNFAVENFNLSKLIPQHGISNLY